MPHRRRVIFAVLAAFGGVVLCIALFGGRNLRVTADQDLFQLPAVRQFAAQWPRPVLRDYPAASAPGYHLLLAAVSHYVSDNLTVLRCVGGVFGFALIALLAWATSKRSAWLALPLAASVYVLSSTVWLLPENTAWLLLLIALLLCLHATGRTLWVGMAVTLALLVLVRQSNAWVLGVFAVTAYAGSNRPLRAVPVAIAVMLPALLILVGLVVLWHGLVPPSFQPGSPTPLPQATQVGGLTIGAPMTALVLFGFFGTPLLAWLWPAGDVRRPVAIGAVAGFGLSVVPRSDYAFNRRFSGFWNVIHHLPTFAGRSPVVIGLATLGGVVAAVALTRLKGRTRVVLATALFGFVLSQSMSALLWQRYYEPFVLIWLALTCAADAPESRIRPVWRTVGLAVLVTMQIAVTAVSLRTGN